MLEKKEFNLCACDEHKRLIEYLGILVSSIFLIALISTCSDNSFLPSCNMGRERSALKWHGPILKAHLKSGDNSNGSSSCSALT